MGKYEWTERQIREGRGQGSGADYLPWIHVRDFSSMGKSSRLKGWKSGLSPTALLEPPMIGLMEPLAGPGKRVSNGAQFRGVFGFLATAVFGVWEGVSAAALAVR